MAQQNQKLMQEISRSIIETSKQQRKDFSDETLILELCCASPEAPPQVIAEQFNALETGFSKSRGDIIRTFRVCRLDHISERIALLKECGRNGQQLRNALEKNDPAAVKEVKQRLDTHIQAKRLTLLAMLSGWKSQISEEANRYLLRMNRDFANECLDTILDLCRLREPAPKGKREKRSDSSAEAYEEEIFRLNAALNRANNLVTRLQDSYEEQMIEIRANEEIRMISMLNSEKYGFILDLLLSAQNGFRQLRKKGMIPFEIKSVQSLTRRMMEFVEDCGITPMLEVGERLSVQAADLDGYSYEGTPFTGSGETKQVTVVSPGWRVQEKDLVISYPRVKEILEEV